MDHKKIKDEKRRWTENLLNKRPGELHHTDWGDPVEVLYSPDDIREGDYLSDLGFPGEYPFVRGVHPNMYLGRAWTMRQYSGFGTPDETNKRFKYLLEQGQTGLSVAFDLPTQIGYDSDDPLSTGEVGKVGVPVDTLQDMETIFEDLPLDKLSTSMTINATAAILLAMYIAVAEKQAIASKKLRGTIQNDILKEYTVRGTYIFPPRPSIRLITDIFAFCKEHVPLWNTINVAGYHMREAGCSAVQEIAFSFSNAITYIEAGLKAGLDIDSFAPRISWIFNTYNKIFEEVAKYRAARKVWADILRYRFNAKDPRSWMLRFHTQTSGVSLTAQQPENNIVRVTLQALSAVLGGTQSLHTNSFDEALGLPTQKSAMIALRSQQIIAHESGAAWSVDPLAGSYYVEYLTDELEKHILAFLDKIDQRGGALKCIESSYFQNEIARSAYEYQKRLENDEDIEVGVNRFQVEENSHPEILRIDKAVEEGQIKRLREIKASRDQNKVTECLDNLEKAARSSDNMVDPVLEAVANRVTIGEISNRLRDVWGVYEAH